MFGSLHASTDSPAPYGMLRGLRPLALRGRQVLFTLTALQRALRTQRMADGDRQCIRGVGGGMRTAKPMPLTSTTAVVESTAATVPVS